MSNNSKTNNSNYEKFIASLKVPSSSPEIENAKTAVEEETAKLKEVAAGGDVAKIMQASAEVATKTAALEKLKAAFKPEPLTAAEIACRLIFEEGFRMAGERGQIDYMARAVCRVMQDATGTQIAIAATRTTCSALLHALKTRRIMQPEETAAAKELAAMLNNQQ